jgi:hypothetical protein
MIDVGGDLTAARLGYGAMRITGPGVWGEPPDRDPGQGRAAAGCGPRRHLHRHRGCLRSGGQRAADRPRRCTRIRGTGHRDQGWPGPAGPGRRVPDGRPKHLRHTCGSSLARLRLDRIDLYQLHRNFSEDQLREAERVTPVVSVQNVAAAGLELRPDEVTAVTSRPDAGILGLPRGLARNRRARTPRLPAAARPEHRSMSTE